MRPQPDWRLGVVLALSVLAVWWGGARPSMAALGDNVIPAAAGTFKDGASCATAPTFPGSGTGWATKTNATVSVTTAQSDGDGCALQLSSVASGAIEAYYRYPAVAGNSYTFSTKWRSATTVRGGVLRLQFNSGTCDSLGGYLDHNDTAIENTPTASWATKSITMTAPASAGCLQARVSFHTPNVASEVHYIDTVSITSPQVDPNPPTTTTTTTAPPTTTTTTTAPTTTTTTAPMFDPTCQWEYGGVAEAVAKPCVDEVRYQSAAGIVGGLAAGTMVGGLIWRRVLR